MRLKHVFFLLIPAFFASCETEVDLFGDVEEVPVVFALMDQGDTVQYMRINPTFVGEGDGRQLAGDPSLTNYDAGEVEVRLYDLNTIGNDGNPIYYKASETTDIPLRDDGIFDKVNRLYKISSPITFDNLGRLQNTVLIADHEFRLWIKHVPTGKIYTSQISIGDVNDLKMINPPDVPRDRITSHLKFYSGEQYVRYTFQIAKLNGASRYKLEMRYYYSLGADSGIADSSVQYVQYNIGEVRDENQAATTVTLDYDGEKFYQIMSSILDRTTSRRGRRVDFIVTAAGNDLDTYIEVQNASLSGLSQERPSYTNVDGGALGVFSFRSTKLVQGYYLNSPTAKWIVTADNDYNRDQFDCVDYGSTAGERFWCN